MTDRCSVTRRDFLRGGLVAGGIAGTTMTAEPADAGTASADTMADASAQNAALGRLIASAPVLMNPAETSVGVAFAVSADASGWAEYSTSPDMREATRVFSGDGCVMRVDSRFACIRIRDLKPATRYFYRIGADRIEFENDYKRRNLGPEVDPKIRSFTTLGADAEGSFCVINDTHDRKPIVGMRSPWGQSPLSILFTIAANTNF